MFEWTLTMEGNGGYGDQHHQLSSHGGGKAWLQPDRHQDQPGQFNRWCQLVAPPGSKKDAA